MIRGLLIALVAIATTLLFMHPHVHLGGVFAPVSTLPHWAQALSHANPAFYMVNAFQYGILGKSDVPVGVALGVMSASAIALFLAAASLAGASGIRD